MADLFGKPKKLGKQDPSTRKWSGRLHDAFVNTLASYVTPETLNTNARLRKPEGSADASINREFALLRRMFNLAKSSNK